MGTVGVSRDIGVNRDIGAVGDIGVNRDTVVNRKALFPRPPIELSETPPPFPQAPPPFCAAQPMKRWWEGRPRPPARPAWCCPRRCPTPPSSPSPPKCSEWAGLRLWAGLWLWARLSDWLGFCGWAEPKSVHWTEVVCGRGLRLAGGCGQSIVGVAWGVWAWPRTCPAVFNGDVGGRGFECTVGAWSVVMWAWLNAYGRGPCNGMACVKGVWSKVGVV